VRTALIPPIPELKKYGKGEFHLLLSHLMDNSEYAAHYMAERQRGAYLVLDNSAHEFKVGQAAQDLKTYAEMLNAQEVVVPDALEDGPQTVELAIATLEAWYEEDDTMATLNPALMYVPQGQDESEWKACFEELVQLHVFMSKRVKGFRRSFVLGVSKDYDVWDGGLIHLLREYVAPMRERLWQEREIKMQVHMLGWMRYLWHLNEIAKEFPWIRSTDSAKPFVYARGNITTSPAQPIPPYPTRPDDYFERSLTQHQRAHATRNVKVFGRAATGTLFDTDIVYV
jgi:hypothetical protein